MSGPKVGPPSSHILEEEVRDEILLYDSERERFVSLSSTASDIWRLVTGEFSVEEIVSRLATSYDEDPAAIRPDVEATIAELVDLGLITLET